MDMPGTHEEDTPGLSMIGYRLVWFDGSYPHNSLTKRVYFYIVGFFASETFLREYYKMKDMYYCLNGGSPAQSITSPIQDGVRKN
jgi:hypothetical protein